MDTEFSVFHNRLRKLLNIDMWQLVQDGVISPNDTTTYQHFASDPFRFFIRADTEAAMKIWNIMEKK